MFDPEQIDALGKILQAGAAFSGRRMSELADARWKVSVSGIRSIDLETVPALFEQDPMPHTSAALFVREPCALAVVLFFPDWGLPPLVKALGRSAPNLQAQGGMERAAASDAANILGHGVLKAFADYYGDAFIALAPHVTRGNKKAALTEFCGQMPPTVVGLLAQTEFYSDNQASASTLLLLADAEPLRALMASRGSGNAS